MVRTWIDRVNDLARVIEVSAARGNLQNVARVQRAASRRVVVAQRNGRLDEAEAYRRVMDRAAQYLRGDRPEVSTGKVRRIPTRGKTRKSWIRRPFPGPIPPGPRPRVPPAMPPARPDPGFTDAELADVIQAGGGATDAVLAGLEAAGVRLPQIRRVVKRAAAADYRYHEDPRTDPDRVREMIEERGGPTDAVLEGLTAEGVPQEVIGEALAPPPTPRERFERRAKELGGGPAAERQAAREEEARQDDEAARDAGSIVPERGHPGVGAEGEYYDPASGLYYGKPGKGRQKVGGPFERTAAWEAQDPFHKGLGALARIDPGAAIREVERRRREASKAAAARAAAERAAPLARQLPPARIPPPLPRKAF